MSHEQIAALRYAKRQLEEELERRAGGRFKTIFPLEGPHRRALYPKHLQFFELGATKKERLFMAANRVGKTRGGAFEVTCHTTGRYPEWWNGRRFDEPGEWLACGTTSETTRDIVQSELVGSVDPLTGAIAFGRGMIPAEDIVHHVRRSHAPIGTLEAVWVRHRSGGISQITFKNYSMGRKAFEGTAKLGIWDDEEPPADIYSEQLYRTATTGGITIVTFTPLQGMSDVVLGFLRPNNPESREFKVVIQAGWAHVPHIPEDEKRALLATTPPHEVKARTEGEPSLGAGAIYPIPESEIKTKRFQLPKHYVRGFGADTGWNWFGAVWVAQDLDTGVAYLYEVYKRGQAEPPVHAQAIKDRGIWIPGVMDASDIDKNDGTQTISKYRSYGLDVTLPNKAVETGIREVWTQLSTGKLKVFDDLEPFFEEYRLYHRDEKGEIVKLNDHVLDALRYQRMASLLDRMKAPPVLEVPVSPGSYGYSSGGGVGWMA